MLALRTLNLARNHFAGLPSGIGALRMLEMVDLSHNRLREVPVCLLALGKLRQLCLGYNQIAALPTGLGRLKHLDIIKLEGNKLTALPDDIGTIHCQEMILSENQLPVKNANVRDFPFVRN